MAQKLINWTPDTPVGHIGRELDQLYATAITTDLANQFLIKDTGAAQLQIRAHSGQGLMGIFSFNNSPVAGSRVQGYRGRGTNDARLGVQLDDYLFKLDAWGFNPSGVAKETASVNFRAGETWGASAQGSYFSFEVTPNGTTTPTEILKATSTEIETQVPVLDPTKRIWLHGADFQDASATATFASSSGTVMLSFPDSAVIIATNWFECPVAWIGRAVKATYFYQGFSTSNNYSITTSINSKKTGDGFGRNGSLDTTVVPEGGASNIIRSFSGVFTHTVTAGATMMFLEVRRNGTAGSDTSTNGFNLLGALVELV